MELKHLRAFVVLAEELHFGKAAQRLCIVQSALSMQIKALEDELDVRLLERDRHKVALSETGALFLPEARATLHQALRAEQTARLSARGEIGTLRIAFVSSVLLSPFAPNESTEMVTGSLAMTTPRDVDSGLVAVPA